MNIKDYAVTVLNMNSLPKREQAISKLNHGLKHEQQWNDEHKRQVKQLVAFLSSTSTDINDLDKYCPAS